MPLTFEFCRDRICPHIVHYTEFDPPKQYFTCGDGGPCIENLDTCPENRQPATREELDKAHGFELIHPSREWIDEFIKAAEAAEASKPGPLEEIVIAEDEQEYGWIDITATPAGIQASYSTGSPGYRGEIGATWAEVLKHAPAEAMEEEQERRGL